MKYEQNYVVIDSETGGLKASDNPIVEIAMVALDNDLNEIGSFLLTALAEVLKHKLSLKQLNSK